MSTPSADLPDMAQVANIYRRGASYATIGARYGCCASTVRNRLLAWAQANEIEWPLRHVKDHAPRPSIISAKLVRKEIAQTCRRFRISQKQLAELAGVAANTLHKISGGHKDVIFIRTQGKILEACSKLYAGEVVLPHTKQLILPMHARDICSNGHPWRGARWPNGVRRCNQCVAAKHARADAKRSQKVAS